MTKTLKDKISSGLNQTGKFIQKNWKEIGLTGAFLFNMNCSTRNFITEHGYEFSEINQTNNKYKTEKLFLYAEENYVRKIDADLYSSLVDSIKREIISIESCPVDKTKNVHNLDTKKSTIKFTETFIPKQVKLEKEGIYLPANRVKLTRDSLYTNNGQLIPAANAKRTSDEELIRRNMTDQKNLAYKIITTEEDEKFNLLTIKILDEWYFVPYIENKQTRNEPGKKPHYLVPVKGASLEVCGNERGSIDLINPRRVYREELMDLREYIAPQQIIQQDTTISTTAGNPAL